MEYQVTARKWRPQKFDNVVGQEHITSTLKNALKSGKIAHAFLFTGPRGVGKTTTARILAKSLNCENPKDYEPCNACAMCKSISSSQTMDIIEIDGASNRGIDEIRTLRESVKYAPTQGRYKVYIIDEVHMLTKESFNAFLKTLEEPPAHTIFIFATTDVHKVPLTIISRCQRFDFRRIQLDVIKNLLLKIAKSEGIQIDDKTLTTISKKADGALRDAESYFDQVVAFCGNEIDFKTVSKMLNLIDDDLYFRFSDAVLNKEFKIVFEITGVLYSNGWDFIDFLDGLNEHFRNILTVIVTGQTSLIESADIYKEKYSGYTNSFSKGDVLRILNFINKTRQDIRFSQNQRLTVEISLTHLVGLERSETISEIISQINSGNLNTEYTVPEPQKKKAENLKNPSGSHKTEKTNVSLPNTKKKTSSSVTAAASPFPASFENIEDIVSTWQSLVDTINDEKLLFLTSFFANVSPLNFDGNNLTLTAASEDVELNFELHKEHINKRVYKTFGKKISLKIVNKKEGNKGKNKIKSEGKGNSDPIEKIIIEDLSGEEIG